VNTTTSMTDKRKGKEKEKDKEKEEKEKELDESSSDDDEESSVKIKRVGYIEVQREKKKWTAMYCVLIGGSFYYYKNSSDAEPKGNILLKDIKVVTPVPDEKKKSTFSMVKGDEALFVGACPNDKELEQWLSCIKANVSLEAAEPPTASVKKKDGVLARVKRKTASATATSALGKKVMKTIVNDETKSLLEALKRIVKSESGSQKKADDLENNIIRIAVKSFLLVENKKLQADDFLVADKPLREAFELMVKVFNGRKRVKPKKIQEALGKVEALLKKAEEVITNLLAPNLTSKNMLKISQAFGCIADVKFLVTVFKNEELEPDLDKLIDAMEYYTQFHYN